MVSKKILLITEVSLLRIEHLVLNKLKWVFLIYTDSDSYSAFSNGTIDAADNRPNQDLDDSLTDRRTR